MFLRDDNANLFDSDIAMKLLDTYAESLEMREKSVSQFGFSLVELMVAMTIGLFLVAVIGVLFVNSRATYLAQDANSRVQENSRFAVELLARQIRAAGDPGISFVTLNPSNPFAPLPPTTFSGTPITGTDPASAAPDSISVSFNATVDCLGQTVTSPVVNLFRINAQKQLECQSGSGTTGVLLDDVEDMQVTYGQPTPSRYAYLAAGDATMSAVTAVRVCLLLRAKADVNKRVNSASQTYVNCQGNSVAATDGYLRRSITMTTGLRVRLK